MTLLELLVKELPCRGGWPDGVYQIETHKSGSIFFNEKYAPEYFSLPMASDAWNTTLPFKYTNAVTREQYEAAIAAQQSVWNGEGLPPVGVECEIMRGISEWRPVVINFISENLTVFKTPDDVEKCYHTRNLRFRPIRTEADRKREDTLKLIRQSVTNYNKTDVVHAIEELYDAIEAGKIPGVKLV